MKIAVMGAGAVGCYYGGMLARAGHDVMLIARPQHVEAVRRSGLRLQTDAQVTELEDRLDARWVWRFISEDPKFDLVAESTGEGERSTYAVLPFATACLERAR